LGNQNRGADQEPAFHYLQQAILMAEAASGVLLWLMREKSGLGLPEWSIPFKQSRIPGWPKYYMSVPE